MTFLMKRLWKEWIQDSKNTTMKSTVIKMTTITRKNIKRIVIARKNIRKIITVKIVQMIWSFIMKIQKRNTKKQMNIYGLHLLMK